MIKKINVCCVAMGLFFFVYIRADNLQYHLDEPVVHPASSQELTSEELEYLTDLEAGDFLDYLMHPQKKVQKKSYIVRLQEQGKEYVFKFFIHYLHLKEYLQRLYVKCKQMSQVYLKSLF